MTKLPFDIDPEIACLLPSHTDEQKESLRAEIAEHMHVDPGVVGTWPCLDRPVLLDGHGRLPICQAEHLIFPTRTIKFENREAAVLWVVKNQMKNRRNLTDAQQAYYRGEQFLLEKKPHGGDRKGEKSKVQNELLIGETAKRIAEEHGVSAATIRRDAEFAKAVDTLPPKEKEEVLSGKSGKSKEEVASKGKPTKPPAAAEAVTDAEGVEVPEHARLAFAATKEINAVCKQIDAIILSVEEISNGPGGRLIRFDSVKQQLKDAKGNLWANRPTHVCPYCHGKKGKKPCECCKDQGWTAKHIWHQTPGNNEKAKRA